MNNQPVNIAFKFFSFAASDRDLVSHSTNEYLRHTAHSCLNFRFSYLIVQRNYFFENTFYLLGINVNISNAVSITAKFHFNSDSFTLLGKFNQRNNVRNTYFFRQHNVNVDFKTCQIVDKFPT